MAIFDQLLPLNHKPNVIASTDLMPKMDKYIDTNEFSADDSDKCTNRIGLPHYKIYKHRRFTAT